MLVASIVLHLFQHQLHDIHDSVIRNQLAIGYPTDCRDCRRSRRVVTIVASKRDDFIQFVDLVVIDCLAGLCHDRQRVQCDFADLIVFVGGFGNHDIKQRVELCDWNLFVLSDLEQYVDRTSSNEIVVCIDLVHHGDDDLIDLDMRSDESTRQQGCYNDHKNSKRINPMIITTREQVKKKNNTY